MKINDMEQKEFQEFLQNPEQLVLQGKYDHVMHKLPIPEHNGRFVGLYSANSAGYAPELKAAGIYDTQTEEIYELTVNIQDFIQWSSYEELFKLIESTELKKELEPLAKSVIERIENEVNDPNVRKTLVDEYLDAHDYYTEDIREEYKEQADSLARKEYLKGNDEVDQRNRQVSIDKEHLNLAYTPDLLMDYIENPDKTISKCVDEQLPQYNKAVIHKELIYRVACDMLNEMNTHISPNLKKGKDIVRALEERFGQDMPKNLSITVARAGESATFKFPTETLMRAINYSPESYLPEYDMPRSDRDVVTQTFGERKPKDIRESLSPNIYLEDIVNIEFRRDKVYATTPEDYEERIKTKVVNVKVYAPEYETANTVMENERKVGFNTEAFDPLEKTDVYSSRGEFKAVVGANATLEQTASQIMKQAHGLDLCRTGFCYNVLNVDGKDFLIGKYASLVREVPGFSEAFDMSTQKPVQEPVQGLKMSALKMPSNRQTPAEAIASVKKSTTTIVNPQSQTLTR